MEGSSIENSQNKRSAFEDLKDASLKILRDFDSNQDQKLSDEELGAALKTEFKEEKESRAAASLFLGKDSLAKLATESGKTLNEEGINRISELDKINAFAPVIKMLGDVGHFLQSNLRELSTTGSKTISKEAINNSINSGKFTNENDLAKLQFIAENFDEIKSFAEGDDKSYRSNSKSADLTLKNISTLEAASNNYEGTRLISLLNNVARSSQKAYLLDASASKLYGDQDNFLKEFFWPKDSRAEAV